MQDNREWMEDVYRANYPRMVAVARQHAKGNVLLLAEVEDTVQEVMLLLARKCKVLRFHPNIEGFLVVAVGHVMKACDRGLSKVQARSAALFDDEVGAKTIETALLEDELLRNAAISEAEAMLEKVEQYIGSESLGIISDYFLRPTERNALARRLGISEVALRMRVSRINAKIQKNFRITFIFFICLLQTHK